MIDKNDTICAPATAPGIGALAIIRISGKQAFEICQKLIPHINFTNIPANKVKYTVIKDTNDILDEVMLTIFKAPASYTGEDTVEITCHGSTYIQNRILQLLVKHGARIANPGEFTLRAFLNGKKDLIQAEAVADLIYSASETSHRLAINQMRGGFSREIKELKYNLTEFASLLELELDFGEEDVEFANREKLKDLLVGIINKIAALKESYTLGNVLKKGIPVTITGKPNVGKSTLLNALLNEEKAIVSEIPGTTRDAIEDTIVINGVAFRFIDTAGLRQGADEIENLGIEKTYSKLNEAMIILYVVDITQTSLEEIKDEIEKLKSKIHDQNNKKIIVIANKIDLLVQSPKHFKDFVELEVIFISAKRKENIKLISDSLIRTIESLKINDINMVSNARHYEALVKSYDSLQAALDGLNKNLTTELVAFEIRHALHYLGELLGEITSQDILNHIFDRFCIGK